MSILPPAPDGTPAADDFIAGTLDVPCAVADHRLVDDLCLRFREDVRRPQTIADFFDLEKFPGKRGIRKSPKANLEMALMADGVPG